MTPTDERTPRLRTGAQWEKALVNHYLSSDGPYGATPITFLDATPAELAIAWSNDSGTLIETDTARAWFLSSFDHDELSRALGSGKFPRPVTSEVPGYFRYLILTCLVPAITEYESVDNQFRHILGEMAHSESGSFNALGSLSKLWKSLESWLNKRRSGGLPFRRLVLPDIGRMNLIGYSVRLSFPSWRDTGTVRTILSGCGQNDPTGIINAFDRKATGTNMSGLLRDAYEDFRRRYQSGDRLLLDHRFWRLVQIAKGKEVGDLSCRETCVRLEIFSPWEREFEFALAISDGSDEPDRIDIAFDRLDDVRARIPDTTGARGLARFFQMLSDGFLIVERSSAYSTWVADFSGSAKRPVDFVRVLVSPSTKKSFSEDLAKWDEIGGGWWISSELDPSQRWVASLLNRSDFEEATDIYRLAFSEGIRMGRTYLGRSAALPKLAFPNEYAVCVKAMGVVSGAPIPERDLNAQTVEFSSAGPVCGRWEISATKAGAEIASVSIVFEPDAQLHETITRPADTDKDIVVSDLCEPASSSSRQTRTVEIDVDPRMVDLGEIFYAKGKSGLDESFIVRTIRRTFGGNCPSPWDIMRCFQEAGWLDPYTKPGWGTRRWYLRKARLLRTGQNEFLLDGASPRRLTMHFEAICKRIGGRLLTDSNVPLSAPTFSVTGIDDVLHLSASLGLPVDDVLVPEFSKLPGAWPPEAHDTFARTPIGSWSWNFKRFVASENPPAEASSISIRRWIRPNNDTRPIYTVNRRDDEVLKTSSRAAAIMEGHRLARIPMFEWRDGFLWRSADEGHLPIEIARFLRASAGPGGLVSRTERLFDYVYPTSDLMMTWMNSTLDPALFGRNVQKTTDGLNSTVLYNRRIPHGKYSVPKRKSLNSDDRIM